MDASSVKKGIKKIRGIMNENKDYLIKLDQQNGDGDLGVSMSEGFAAAARFVEETQETELGKLLMQTGGVFNEAAPSSLGTIISFAFMGMAKSLKGKTETDPAGFAEAVMAGVEKIMAKAGSKPGEKTILDSIYPAAQSLLEHRDCSFEESFRAAAKAAAEGSEATREMKSVHGRAAYYGEKSIGILDGGSVVGKLIFEALSE